MYQDRAHLFFNWSISTHNHRQAFFQKL
jgi:hypothetical protein